MSARTSHQPCLHL